MNYLNQMNYETPNLNGKRLIDSKKEKLTYKKILSIYPDLVKFLTR